MHVLVVEDERRMAGLLAQGLSEEGHHATVAHDGLEAMELVEPSRFDIIVLDLMLPGVDGFEVARKLRARRNQTPILMLTARDSDGDVINGLNCGADDYLTKPFAFDVFLARLRAVARRGPVKQPVCYRIGNVSINTSTREVKRGRRRVDLTTREYILLELLAKRSPGILSRSTILERMWGFDAGVSENTLEVFIHRLRTKLDEEPGARLIHTIRGVGYAFRESADS